MMPVDYLIGSHRFLLLFHNLFIFFLRNFKISFVRISLYSETEPQNCIWCYWNSGWCCWIRTKPGIVVTPRTSTYASVMSFAFVFFSSVIYMGLKLYQNLFHIALYRHMWQITILMICSLFILIFWCHL